MIETPEYSYSMCAFRISKNTEQEVCSPGLLRFLASLPRKPKLTFTIARFPVLNGQIKAVHKLVGSLVPRI